MKNKPSTFKTIITALILFFLAAGIYTLISTMLKASLFDNIRTVLELLLLAVFTSFFYKPLKMLFNPRDFSSKLILSTVALICLAFEFEGLSNIVKAIFNEESKMPKLWWIYIVVLIIVLICAYSGIGRTYSITQLDNMEGHEFEYACADILRANGFKNVEVTRGSGDFGVDVLAEKKGVKYAIQCKCYSHKLDNTPVQEVIGGLACYGCTKGAVMTNQYFTEPAKELARINGVELWDRDVIQKMSCKTSSSKKSSKKSQKSLQYKQIENDIALMNEEIDKIDKQLDEIEKKVATTTNDKDEQNQSYINSITAINKLEEYEEIATKYIAELATDIMSIYSLNGLEIEFKNAELLYSSNEVILEFTLCEKARISQFKNYIRQIPKSLSVDYAEYVYPTSTPKTVGIKMPLPKYLEKTSTLIYETTKK